MLPRKEWPEPQRGDVEAALERVCASPQFAHARKLTQFLRFIVETTLAGGASRIKGYTIGIEAFRRPDDFDPQVDPIVRVEAVRLRAALARYYAGAGAGDPVVIELPRGGYVPRFRWRTDVEPAVRPHLRRAVRRLQRWLSIRVVFQLPKDPH